MKKSFLQDLIRGPRRRIFISYRRHGDGSGYGGRLADGLLEHFGRNQCYLDVEHVEPGFDFVQSIEKGIADCEVLIVVIGPDWITQQDQDGNPRLHNPNDWVRIETATGLKRKIRVIPVLVGGAALPKEDQLPDDLKELCRRQAHELSDSRWTHDVGKLIESIEKAGIKGGPSPQQIAFRKKLKISAAISAPLLVGLLVFFAMRGSQDQSMAANLPSQATQADKTAIASLQSELVQSELETNQEARQRLKAEREQNRLEEELQKEKAKRKAAEEAKKELEKRAMQAQQASAQIDRPSYVPARARQMYFTVIDRLDVDQYGSGQISEVVTIDIAGNKQLIALSALNGKTGGSVRFNLPKEGLYEYEVKVATMFNNHHDYGEQCTHAGYGRDRIFIRDGQVFTLMMDASTLGDARYRTWLEPVARQ